MKKIFSLILSLCIIASLGLMPVPAFAATVGIYNYEITDGKVTITDCDENASGDIIIPSSIEGCPVTTIGNKAFWGCDSLTSVTIPDSVTTIGDYAFYYCDSLTSVTIPDSVTTIGNWAFDGCFSLTAIMVDENNMYYCSENGVLFSKDKKTLICYPAGKKETSYMVQNGVTTIGDGAFLGCDSLTSVTIPDSVTTIGDSAFEYCSGLTSVTIPGSVTTIGYSAFYGCSGLTSVTIPDSVTTIGYRAFYYCRSLTSVTIPDSVTTIGDYAFSWCSGLTSVTIPDSVTTIGDRAFYYCYSLTSVTISDSVTIIGNYAFEYCSRLTSVTIPDSVTVIGDWAFYYCSGLTDVYYSGSESRWNSIQIGEYNDPLLNAIKHFNIKQVSPGIWYDGTNIVLINCDKEFEISRAVLSAFKNDELLSVKYYTGSLSVGINELEFNGFSAAGANSVMICVLNDRLQPIYETAYIDLNN